MNDIDTIDNKIDSLPINQIKPKLTIEHVAALLQKNYSEADIARHLFVTRQAVNQFIDRHQEILNPLIDSTDAALALKLKREAIEITNSIDPADRKKASLQQKVTSAAICVEKYRLLSDKSTSNVAYNDISQQVVAIEQELARYGIIEPDTQDTDNSNDGNDTVSVPD